MFISCVDWKINDHPTWQRSSGLWLSEKWLIVEHVLRVWYNVLSTELDKDEDMTKKRREKLSASLFFLSLSLVLFHSHFSHSYACHLFVVFYTWTFSFPSSSSSLHHRVVNQTGNIFRSSLFTIFFSFKSDLIEYQQRRLLLLLLSLIFHYDRRKINKPTRTTHLISTISSCQIDSKPSFFSLSM